MTIICGENNTGKTYATYALYGFFDFWKNGFLINIEDNKINELMEKGTLVIQLDYYKNNHYCPIKMKNEQDRTINH